jgi:RHS repeat-associated protein
MSQKSAWVAVLISAIVLTLSQRSQSQTDPNAGILPFSTHLGGQYDSVDTYSGNVTLTIPLMSKTGKIPFYFNLLGNFRTFCSFSGTPPTCTWIAGNAFGGGLRGIAPTSNGLSYTTTLSNCNGTQSEKTDSNFAFVDATGAAHPFGLAGPITYGPCTGSGIGGNFPATDGSGYVLVIAVTNPPVYTTYDRAGNKMASQQVTDPDGVSLSSANVSGSVVYTDTLGQPTITASYFGGNGGSPPPPDTYTYKDVSGNTQTVTVNYTPYTSATNFGCTGSIDRNWGTFYFPTSVVLADGETFGLTYESTPGISGAVTGRLSRITLPEGGSISYAYTGGQNGIDCTTFRFSTITRTIADGNGHSSPWTYSQTTTNGIATTTVADPLGNSTVYTFGAAGGSLQTQAVVYDAQHNVLSTTVTCYNGKTSSSAACVNPSQGVFFPVTQTDIYRYQGASLTPSLTETIYDYTSSTASSYGDVTTVKRWSVGTYPPSGSPVSTTTMTYANVNGVTCGTAMQYIHDHPCTNTTTNSSGITVSQAKYTYNTGGHPTLAQNWVVGTTFLTSSATYNANGTIASSTDANGQPTTYAYNGVGGCNNLLLTSTSTVINSTTLTSSEQWDCVGGVVKNSTDINSQVTTFSYLDKNGIADPLWRLRSTTDPLLNVTLNTYSPNAHPPTTETAMVFNSGASTVDNLTTFDGLGRPIINQRRQGPAPLNSFDTVSLTYDAEGRVATQSLPCSQPVSTPCPSTPATTTTYDALNRPLQVTDGGGGYTQYRYTPSGSVVDTLVTVGPNPSGESLKQRQLESDTLGRLTSVCEVTGATGSGSCSQAVAATGYKTAYSYDALDRLIGVTQNAQGSPTQTRSFSYDGLSRMLSETNPESGTTTYTYDSGSVAVCGWASSYSTPGDLIKTTDANGQSICYQHDTLHRVTVVGNSSTSATNPVKQYIYDKQTNGLTTPPAGATITNVLGRLVEAMTCNLCNTPVTDEWSSYTARGELADTWQSSPHSGGYYHGSVTYYANGALNSLSGVGQQSQYTYGVDGEGRPKTTTQGSSNFVTNTTYNAASQPLTVSLKLGDSDNYSYDSSTGRMSNFTFTVGSTPKSMVGGLTWNSNGTLSKLAITDGFNAAGNQTCKYGDPTASIPGYDDLSRLIGANCGSVWSQTFSYDPFGNITKNGSITWNPGYNQSNNRYTLAGTTYDADGNLLNDTFHAYTWNVYGKLATVDGTTTLTNDAFDRVVEKNVSGAFSEIEYGPLGKACTMNSITQLQCYVPLPGGEIMSPGPDTFWHVDWLGSVRLASSASQRTITFDRAFAPFGETYNTVTGGTTTPQFAGLTQDTISGEYDTDAREYHPSQGRWISPDPAGQGAVISSNPQSWNRYAYVLNNPLIYTDPTGLYCYYGDTNPDSNDWADNSQYDTDTDKQECADHNGQWFDDPTESVTVNGDTGDVEWIDLSTGNDGPIPIVDKQESSQRGPFSTCVKRGADYFSLANGLNYVTGGKTEHGVVGTLNNAFLGNTVADAIDLFKGNTQPLQNKVIEVGIPKAANLAASLVPDIVSTTTSVSRISVQTAMSSASVTRLSSTSTTLRIGTMARSGTSLATEGLERFGSALKLPLDLATASFSGLVCSIGR